MCLFSVVWHKRVSSAIFSLDINPCYKLSKYISKRKQSFYRFCYGSVSRFNFGMEILPFEIFCGSQNKIFYVTLIGADVKAAPFDAWTDPQSSRRLRHMKAMKLSALRTGRLYPWGYLWYLLLLEAIVRPHAINLWKISLTPTGIKPATSRLVAQCLNQVMEQT